MTIEAIITKVLAAAESARIDAGYGGLRHDNGASRMVAEVAFYRAGQHQKIPEAWEKYALEVRQETDPEYAEFVRLKKKFG